MRQIRKSQPLGHRAQHRRKRTTMECSRQGAEVKEVAMTGESGEWIELKGVRTHNLRGFDLRLPIGKMIAIAGVSGSGKSSLAFDTLFAEGQRRFLESASPF